MINKSVLIGRMTKDPELRRTAQGDAVTSFNLAVNRNYAAKDGQQQADFILCICWNKTAENVERYCSKGSLVGVEGRLQSRNYENSHGQKVFVIELVCDLIQFLDSKKDNNQQSQNSFNQPLQSSFNQSTQNNFNQPTQDNFNPFDIDPNDIQF